MRGKQINNVALTKAGHCRRQSRRRERVSVAGVLIMAMQLGNTIALQVNHSLWRPRPMHAVPSSHPFSKAKFFMTKSPPEDDSDDQRDDHHVLNNADAGDSSAISVSKIVKFAIPAMGIWICSPLLSVIDTSAVGLLSGTVQQAALNPAVAVTDYSGRCMSFLFTATTNLVAISYKADGQKKGAEKLSSCTNTLVGALRVSLRVGLCMCAFLLLLGNAMLRGLVGTSSSSAQEVLLASRKYVWIRALGMPAAAMIGTAQAACLGMQDTTSPLITTFLAAFVNLVADIAFVRQSHPWIGGVAGAAWATILSQYVAVAFYLRWLRGGSLPNISLWKRFRRGAENESDPTPIDAGSLRQRNVRGILKGRMGVRDMFVRRKSEKSTAQDFAPYLVPVTTTQVGRCSVYVAMGIVVSAMDVVNMAGNQILNAFFYALIPVADSLSQTAQALLPPLFLDSSPEGIARLRSSMKSFVKAALLCGAGLVGVVASIPFLTKTMMTTDIAVQTIVNSVVPIHIWIFLFHGIFCASEGILLAQKDLGFLGKMYGVYFVVVPTLILQLQHYGSQLRLQTVWYAFMAYQFFRISAWVTRVYYLFRKRAKAVT